MLTNLTHEFPDVIVLKLISEKFVSYQIKVGPRVLCYHLWIQTANIGIRFAHNIVIIFFLWLTLVKSGKR